MDTLGRGWRFDPVKGTGLDEQGEIALSQNEQDVREAIWIILATAPGERVMRPDFGCGIHDYLFEPNNARTAGLIRFAVEEALVRWEPRIQLDAVVVRSDPQDPAVVRVDIDYRVRATDTRFNMVYPFYLERGETP